MTVLNVADVVDNIEEQHTIPSYVAEAAYKIGSQRCGHYPMGRHTPECELTIINRACLSRGITPTQEIYDEVYAELSGF